MNNQVAFSLKRFAHDIHEGSLTVVGAVYDFRNDLGQGAGKLVVVNVNGNSDPERMVSFVEAVNGRAGHEGKEASKDAKEGKDGKGKKAKSERAEAPAATKDIAAELSKIRGISTQATEPEPLAAREPAHEPAAHGHGHEH